VVHPTVGLPLLIGSVAVTSLIVHASVMTNTSWMSNYWEGGQKKAAALEESTTIAPVADSGYTITVKPVAVAASADPSFTITVSPAADGSADALKLAAK
jgi:light-harvesting protein B-800-850 alpha chain